VKLTITRAIPLVVALGLVAFMTSGIGRFKNATHGLDYVVGEIAWLGFLAAVLALVALTAVALYRRRTRGRATVIGSCLAATLALSLMSAAATATTPATTTVTLTRRGPAISGPTTWRPGLVRIAASSRLADQEVTLLRFRPGYTYADFLADAKKARGHGAQAHAAIARVLGQTIFKGGVDLFRGQSASFAVTVRPGTYYLGEMSNPPQLTAIHVTGTPSQATVRSSGTLTAADHGYRVSGRLPAHGTITFANASSRPHRVNLIPVKQGTTRSQALAYIRKTHGRDDAPPPPFALRGPQIGSADLSPHQRVQLTYRLPAGTYVALDFDQDAQTGRPETLEGLVAVVRLR
jgi:hypothetical protein